MEVLSQLSEKDEKWQFVPQRGRPTSAQIAAIEESILSTARRLFLADGYAKTSMKAIASEARVSKGTLYARYPSKEDVFRAIVKDRHAAWPRFVPPDEATTDIEGRLLARAIYILSGMRNPEIRAFDELLSTERKNFPELGRHFYELGFQLYTSEIAADLEAARRAAGQSAQNAHDIALMFLFGLLGWIRLQTRFRTVSDDECEQFARRAVALCINGQDAW